MSDEVTSRSAAAEPMIGSDTSAPTDGTEVSPTVRRPRHRVPDDAPVIPERSADDSDLGWGDGPDSNDDRLRRDVPPHW